MPPYLCLKGMNIYVYMYIYMYIHGKYNINTSTLLPYSLSPSLHLSVFPIRCHKSVTHRASK